MENLNLVIQDNAVTELAKEKLINFFKLKADLEKAEKELREAFLVAFENSHQKTIKTDDIVISYKSATVRESFDSKKFKEEHEDLYNQYVKITDVKPSVSFSVKKGKE